MLLIRSYINIVESVKDVNEMAQFQYEVTARHTGSSCFVPGKTPLAAPPGQVHVINLQLDEGRSMKLPTKPGPLRHARVRRAW